MRHEWIEGLKQQNFSLGERTKNRLESTFQRIKSVTTHNMPVHEVLPVLWKMLTTLTTEKRYRALTSLSKIYRGRTVLEEPRTSYASLLTPHAFKTMSKNVKAAPRSSTGEVNDDGITCNSPQGIPQVSTTDCTCTGWKSMRMPCKYMLSASKHSDLSLFAPELVLKRLTKTYYRSVLTINCRKETSTSRTSQNTSQNTIQTYRNTEESTEECKYQKYRAAVLLTTRLATVTGWITWNHLLNCAVFYLGFKRGMAPGKIKSYHD